MNPADTSVAFGAPGIEPRWTSSAKEGLGTAYHISCRLWFTLSHGTVNEVFYPTVDQPNTRDFQFLISWLLDLAGLALLESPDLAKFAGRVSDPGEGRWTVMAAIDEAFPALVLSAALYERFGSRGATDFADKVLSALRWDFGGHEEKATTRKGGAS